MSHPQFFFDKVIELIQIDIGKKLRSEIADGDARVVTGDDKIENLQELRVVNSLTDNLIQNIVINRGKKLGDIALERVNGPFFTQERLKTGSAAVRAFIHAAGIGVKDKTVLKQRFNDRADGMVDDTVGKRRGGDAAELGVVDEKLPVRAWLPSTGFQRQLYFQKARIHLGGKAGYRQAIALAAAGQFPGPHQIGECGNLKKETRRQHNFYCMLMCRGAGSLVCAAIRSGNWDNGANDGPFTLNLNNAPSNVNTNIGFRCASIQASFAPAFTKASAGKPEQNRRFTEWRSLTNVKIWMITDSGYRVPVGGRGEISNRTGWGASRFPPRPHDMLFYLSQMFSPIVLHHKSMVL